MKVTATDDTHADVRYEREVKLRPTMAAVDAACRPGPGGESISTLRPDTNNRVPPTQSRCHQLRTTVQNMIESGRRPGPDETIALLDAVTDALRAEDHELHGLLSVVRLFVEQTRSVPELSAGPVLEW